MIIFQRNNKRVNICSIQSLRSCLVVIQEINGFSVIRSLGQNLLITNHALMHLIEIQFIFQSFILDSVVIASAFVDLLYIGLGLGIVLNTYIRVSSPPKQLGYFPSMETEYNSQEHIGVIFRCIYCCGTLITARFQEDFQSTLKLRYASHSNKGSEYSQSFLLPKNIFHECVKA